MTVPSLDDASEAVRDEAARVAALVFPARRAFGQLDPTHAAHFRWLFAHKKFTDYPVPRDPA